MSTLLTPTPRREEIVCFLKELRETILHSFCSLDKSAVLERKPWQHKSGGGGEIGLLRGPIFEKAAVNFSAVWGDQFPITTQTESDSRGSFFATGVSLITHMNNPHAPTVHMNVRYIETEKKSWLAGGYDLTPMGFPYSEDTEHFHHVAKKTLDSFDLSLYPLFSENAKRYFFIPHWNKERGVGGIFFDHYATCSFSNDLTMWKEVGTTFLEAILPIYQKRATSMDFTPEEKALQNRLRAHYVEFNLLYDRGTQFGFASKGNPEAILCSMPPTATW